MSYTKLFAEIVTSTIWSEDDKTRIVWITMLAMANRHGEVMASIPGLAKIASVSIEDTEKALEKLQSPDPYSRSPDEEGRRIVAIEGGWHLVNYERYRTKLDEEDRKKKNAERQRRYRERQKKRNESNAGVTESNDKQKQKQRQSTEEAGSTPTPGGELGLGDAKKPAKKPPAWEPDPLQKRLNGIFRRRDTTRWSEKEVKSFKRLEIEEEDLAAVETYYAAPVHELERDWRRRELYTLLNNWQGEVDRAGMYARGEMAPQKPKINGVAGRANPPTERVVNWDKEYGEH